MSHFQDRFIRVIGLFLFFLAFYMASYSGRIESGDSTRVVDAATSLVHFGDTFLDETLWQEQVLSFVGLDVPYPFLSYESNESLIVYFAAVPVWLANNLQGIGLVHSLWLLNIVLVSLSIASFYLYLNQLGFSDTLAIIACLLLGLTTVIYPYSKTLFREPLAMVLLVWTALSIEIWRKNYRHVWWLLLSIVLIGLSFFTKNSTILAVPALIIFALPDFRAKYMQRVGLIILGIGLASVIIFATIPASLAVLKLLPAPLGRFSVAVVQNALWSYLFSIGGSLWATSPILLLALLGAIQLIKKGKHRLVLAVFSLITAYALGHALLTDIHWFGGLSYPPRFLVPTIPFAMLLVVPVLDWLMQPKRWIWKVLAASLIAFSFAIQVIASVSWLDAYVALLPAESGGLVEWVGGLNDVRYLRWLLLPQSWEPLGFDIAWTRTNASIFIACFLAIAALSIVVVFWHKRTKIISLVQAILFSICLAFGLRYLYANDALYWSNKSALFEVLAIAEREAANGEPLLLAGSADVTYERFIMNYLQSSQLRPVVLGFQPGESTSPSDSPDIVSSNTIDLFLWDIPRVIDYLANHHERIWWLAQNGIFTPWAVRVEERYLSENYYLLHEYTSEDPTVRLLEFSTVRAPNLYDFRLPEQLSDLRFGESIRLTGFTLPLGTAYQAGDVVPISFYWQSDEVLEADYTVSWFIVNEAGLYPPTHGIDSQPQNTFSPTTSWEPNRFIIDNRAIELPLDLPDGSYQIWLRLYLTGSSGAETLTVSGSEIYDETLGILPIRLNIRH